MRLSFQEESENDTYRIPRFGKREKVMEKRWTLRSRATLMPQNSLNESMGFAQLFARTAENLRNFPHQGLESARITSKFSPA